MSMRTIATPLAEAELPRACEAELHAIADWWLTHTIDRERGGFYGEVDVDNQSLPDAPKSIILNTRVLWFFSEAALATGDARYRDAACRAFDYLSEHFVDRAHGGVYWEVDAEGEVHADKKQVYAQGFAIYALCAYYRLSDNPEARALALSLFEHVERHARDADQGGYLEALSNAWGPLEDFRLSDKDLNFPKTMNTHLHILEAYTSLYQVAPQAAVKEALRHTIDVFAHHIIDTDSGHLRMFMGLDWQDHSTGLSYGHDIECSWLLLKALKALGDADLSNQLEPLAVKMAEVCHREALGKHGELMDAYDFSSQRYHTERIWWVQAEALVGFVYAYRHTDDCRYLSAAEKLWTFIKHYQIDTQGGEWFWLSTLDSGHRSHYKVGAWKCPYHNGRAMLEVMRLLSP
ncbi:AGE family epimerase/isomerase [Marinimicrobium alkaliphilum]|uniref:AGE family epimerase/isomerase n=1 Tax=Marinimicrobium alkaliphilum TaxID=2202654 RepID=UPI000DBA91B3|nr:AGE family epimerase/isomerase [Marinimicrobium alkaliphilum]